MTEMENTPRMKYQSEDGPCGKVFRCLICKKSCTSKRRVLGHIDAFHKYTDGEVASGEKTQCYTVSKVHVGGTEKERFHCKLCRKCLSTKYRMLQHLHNNHGKSPLSKVYKRYQDNPDEDVPGRTVRRYLFIIKTADQNTCLQTSSNGLCADQNIAETCESNESEPTENKSTINETENCATLLTEAPSPCDTVCGDSVSSLYSSGSDGDCDDGTKECVESENDSLDNYDSLSSVKSYGSDNVISSGSELSETEHLHVSSESEFSENHSLLSSESDISDDESGEVQSKTSEMYYTDDQSLAFCISAFSARFNLSGDATNSLKKMLSLRSEQITENVHENENGNFRCIDYCSKCFSVFEDETFLCLTLGCGNYRFRGGLEAQTSSNRQSIASFVLADIDFQLRQILEKDGIWTHILETKGKLRQSKTTLNDVTDGAYYRSLCSQGKFLHHQNNISTIFNTDGIPLYSSSNVKLWPVFLAINELPVQKRFARENIILAGIWQGKDKPPFLQYLWKFGEEMCRLYDDGISVRPPCLEEPINVKLTVLCGTVDLQAKGYILNMTMFNGEYGCSTCEENGVVAKQGKGFARCYPYREPSATPQLRNSDDIKYVKGPKASKKNRIKGICGISGLSVMPWFDLVFGIVPDYMHGVLMGVTKKLMSLWFSPASSGKDYFVGKHLKKISHRLNSIHPPDYIERLPRDLERHYTHFKATELQTWLLFYSVPCMKDILPNEYHSHLCLLSEAIYLLLGDNITQSEITRAQDLLQSFYQLYPILYDKGSCGLNVHNIGAHLSFFVEQLGPLWAWSCFPFEDANAAILNSVHGTGDVTKQAIKMKELEMKLRNIDLDKVKATKEKHFLGKLINPVKRRKETPVQTCSIIGSRSAIGNCQNEEDLIKYTDAETLADLQVIQRIQLNGQKFYSKQYSRMKRRVCYVVCTNSGTIIAIDYFVVNNSSSNVYAVGEYLIATDDCFMNTDSGRHIVKVKKSGNVVKPVNEISEKLFYMKIEGETYIARMPNLCGHCIFK